MVESYKKKGALSYTDLLNKKIEEGLWSKDKEKKLSSIQNNVRIMSEKKRKASIPSQIEEIEELIENYEQEYTNIYKEKSSLLNLSAESLSLSPVIEYTIYISFFEDENLKNKAFSIDDVVDFSSEELYEMILEHRRFINLFSNKNLRKISVDKNIRAFIKASSNTETFFGKRGCSLTANQIKLFDFSKYFTGLIDRIEDITEEEKCDPDEIERIFILESNKDQIKPAETRGKLLEVFTKT